MIASTTCCFSTHQAEWTTNLIGVHEDGLNQRNEFIESN